ncbi:hypothetical protein V6N13_117163 [Hibiscus sabdariffa]
MIFKFPLENQEPLPNHEHRGITSGTTLFNNFGGQLPERVVSIDVPPSCELPASPVAMGIQPEAKKAKDQVAVDKLGMVSAELGVMAIDGIEVSGTVNLFLTLIGDGQPLVDIEGIPAIQKSYASMAAEHSSRGGQPRFSISDDNIEVQDTDFLIDHNLQHLPENSN